MPTFDSPIGSRKVPGSPMKELEVPDETENAGHPGYRLSREALMEENARKLAAFQEKMHMQQMQQMQQMQDQAQEQQDPEEFEREIRQARMAKITGKERLGEGAKRRIEMLIGMTRTIRTIDIDGNSFVFQSLKAKEMREAIIAAAEFDGTVQSSFEIRKQFLARSLVKVANVDIDQFIGSDALDAKLTFIEELDDALLNRLYDEYLTLSKEARDKFSIKTDEEAKELVEDLKK